MAKIRVHYANDSTNNWVNDDDLNEIHRMGKWMNGIGRDSLDE